MKTKAEQFAKDFFGTELLDGQTWKGPEGEDWGERLEAAHKTNTCDRVVQEYEISKYLFTDGSSIVCAGDGWDFGLSSDDRCTCWEGCKSHNFGCPLSEES